MIEGEILANTHEDEGPYGEYTGYSTDRSTRNVFIVKAITHRARPIFHDIIPGYSAEHLLLGRATREAHIFLRLQEMAPWVRALNYPKTGTHFHAYVSLRQTAQGQARQAMTLLLGLDPYLKLVIAVDDDVDVFDEQEVLWALATRFQARHAHAGGGVMGASLARGKGTVAATRRRGCQFVAKGLTQTR